MEKISVVDEARTDFDNFLSYGKQREEPQTICAVVCEAAFMEEGEGLSLSPVTCVDKPLQKINNFQDLVNAGGRMGQDWDMMCITMLLGENGSIATAIETNKRLDVMLELIRQGQADKMVIFARDEEHVRLNHNL